jgi:hypothetical protein
VSKTTRTPREVGEPNDRRERRVVVASANPLDLLDTLLKELDDASSDAAD